MKKLILSITICLGFIFSAGAVQAASEISVSPDAAIFNIENAFPGGEYESSEITVSNTGSSARDVQFGVDVTTNPKNLGSLLYMKAVDEGGLCVSNCDFSRNLDNTSEVMIGPIGAGGTEKYKFVIMFDKSAGNEFQNAEIVFDMTVGYRGSEPASISENGDDNNKKKKKDSGGSSSGSSSSSSSRVSAGISAPGAVPAVLASSVETSDPALGSGMSAVSTGNGTAPGEVAGEAVCAPVSWVIFFVILLVYLLLFNANLWHKFEHQKNPRWFWEAAFTVLAIAAWHYLDTCRTNRWFLYVIIITAFLNYLFYLSEFRRKARITRIPPAQ